MVFKTKLKSAVQTPESKQQEGRHNDPGWYSDKYNSIVIQRNFLIIVAILGLLITIISLFVIFKISTSKTIEPFVIEIEKKTGITNVIRPLLKKQFAYDEVLQRYFVRKYITNRETYNYYSYNNNYYNIVRLLSNPRVFNTFRHSINAENKNSPLRLGEKTERFINIKSISYLNINNKEAKGTTMQVRFLSYEVRSNNYNKKMNQKHLIATVTFDFLDLRLNDEERAINPLGFQVINYRVDKEAVN